MPRKAREEAISPAINPWKPEMNQQHMARLGKLIEELNEAATASARCVIQGIDEKHPVTGKPNQEWLLEELADVMAVSELAIDYFVLDRGKINFRRNQKVIHLMKWFRTLNANP